MFARCIHYRIGVDGEIRRPPVECGVGANVILEMAGKVECGEIVRFFQEFEGGTSRGQLR